MERLGSLLSSLGSEVIPDGQIDTSSEERTLSSSSSPGYLTIQATSPGSVSASLPDSLLAGCSSCLYLENGDWIVNPSFSVDLDGLGKSSQSWTTLDFHLTLNEHASKLSSIESSRVGEISSLASTDTAETSSPVSTTALPVSHVSSQKLKTWHSGTSDVKITSDSSPTKDAVIFSQLSPCCVTSELTHPLPTSLVQTGTEISLQISSSTPVDYTGLDVASERHLLEESLFGQLQEAETITSDYNKLPTLQIVPKTAPVLDSSTFRLVESSSKSLHQSSLLADITTIPRSGSTRPASPIFEGRSTELWNFHSLTTTSGEISSVGGSDNLFHSQESSVWSYSSRGSSSVAISDVYNSSVLPAGDVPDSIVLPAHDVYISSVLLTRDVPERSVQTHATYDNNIVPTLGGYGSSVLLRSDVYDSRIGPLHDVYDSSSPPADDNKKSAAANPPVPLTLDKSQTPETSRSLSTWDEADYGKRGTAQPSPAVDAFDLSLSCGSDSTESVACTTPVYSLEGASSHLGPHSQNGDRAEPEWVPSSQVLDVAAGDTSALSLNNRLFILSTDDNLRLGSTLFLSYHTQNDKSELLILSAHGAPLLSDVSYHVPFVQDGNSVVVTWFSQQTDTQSSASYSLKGHADGEFSTVDSPESAGKDGSADIVSTRVPLSVSSPVAELPKPTEASDLEPSGSTETDQLPNGFIDVSSSTVETPTMPSTDLQPSSTVTYDSLVYYPTTTAAVNKNGVALDFPVIETSSHDLLSSQPRILSTATPQDPRSDEARGHGINPALTDHVEVTALSTSDSCSEGFCSSQGLASVVFGPVTVKSIPETSIADGGAHSKQIPSFNTTIIIASGSAVLAVVIVVIIVLVCLRRKKRSKPLPSSRLEGDDMWVDLYRANSSHHMPLPSLTTCQSTFEMSDTLKPGAAQDLRKEKQVPESAASSSQVNQTKSHKHVSSFQIKRSNPDTEHDRGLASPVSELEGPDGQGKAENWVKMTTSVSMTSLPITELSYNTNLTDYNVAAVGHMFRAVYAYKPVCKGEMALKEGELVVCKERDRNGWMFGSKPKTSQEGWFPAVYVDEVSSDYELDFNCDIPETYEILESNKSHDVDQYWTGIEHTVCYSYESSVSGDLNLEPGQTVIVLQTLANGWWFALSGNRCGWIPGSYVEMIEDNSFLEVALNGDHHDKHDQSSVSTESQNTTEGNIETHAAEISTDSEDKTDVYKLHETGNSEKDNARLAGTNKAALTPESQHDVSLKINSSTENETFDRNVLMEPGSIPEKVSEKSMATLTPSMQGPDKPETLHKEKDATNPTSSLSVSSKSTHNDNKPGKSFRPVRPAPPPPKRKNSKVKKENSVSQEANKAQAIVVKKPVILIQGRRPKLQKVLRGRLDDKQLNPMIRPSTRAFIPKPTVNSEERQTHPSYYKQRHEWGSSEHVHTNSSPSIADDFHSELMTLLGQSHQTADATTPPHALSFRPLPHNLGQSHQTADATTPPHALSFRPLPHNDGRSSSRMSLESGSDHNIASPGRVSNHILSVKENLPNSEQSDKKHSINIRNNLSRDRSLTPEYKRERSLTPEYKKEKNISPILLTTGSLLQNVQRFHGALNYPSSPQDTDKGTVRPTDKGVSEAIPRNSSPHAFNVASRRQRTPTTVPPPKVPPKNSSHFRSQQDQSSNHRQQNDETPPPVASSSFQPENTDVDSNREDITDNTRRPSKILRTDSTGFGRDSLVVTPGTVSEIVHQINTQSPLQKELLQKLKGNAADTEMVVITDRKI